jgi:hypothetical protein
VEILEKHADRTIEFGQGGEAPMAKARQDPPLHDLDRDLDLGFVLRLAHSRRHHSHAVVRHKIPIRAVVNGG